MEEETTDLDITKHIQSVLDVVHPKVTTFTFPLFAVDARGRPELYASSVLIECDGLPLLVTAAHAIFDITQTRSAVHLGAKRIVELPSNFILTSKAGLDALDLAAMVLSEELLQSEEMQPLSSACINVENIFPTPHMRCVSGFPCSKNKFESRANEVTHVFSKYGFTYAGASRDLTVDYAKHNKSESIHHALHYQRQSKNAQGQTVTPPKPNGMSGGGMWAVPDTLDPGNLFLDGICIEYRAKSLVFATRIQHVVDFVRQHVLPSTEQT